MVRGRRRGEQPSAPRMQGRPFGTVRTRSTRIGCGAAPLAHTHDEPAVGQRRELATQVVAGRRCRWGERAGCPGQTVGGGPVQVNTGRTSDRRAEGWYRGIVCSMSPPCCCGLTSSGSTGTWVIASMRADDKRLDVAGASTRRGRPGSDPSGQAGQVDPGPRHS